MSDHWEFYPCRVDEDQAFIFYDHGIREEIDGLPYPNVLKVRAHLKDPTEGGMPTNEEAQQLFVLEDLLTTRLQELGGVQVGRITVVATRRFYCFVPFAKDVADRLVQQLAGDSGYELQFILGPDLARAAYWDELFPTPADWRIIQDMKVLEVLESKGDVHHVARRIDHWAYFPRAEARDAFAQWAAGEGFAVESTSDPDESGEDYGIQVYRDGRTELDEINATTLLLFEKATALGGNYDGWETSVENPG